MVNQIAGVESVETILEEKQACLLGKTMRDPEMLGDLLEWEEHRTTAHGPGNWRKEPTRLDEILIDRGRVTMVEEGE